ncbi:unnamed protein product [Rhizoctonia solani]|uniref:Uncharacterized protein n=1 Tax=Rhizoctonia solani TaxID=456999 RepID=A0A8H3AGD6_9AGAM|nr:unnamed protein product [Rhizoctonia solani]CAE6468190.1 unnamed protein product [Rhizoctonia solani]
MVLPDAVQAHVSALEIRLAKCKRKLNQPRKAKKFEEHNKVCDEDFIGIFKDTCSLVREAELTDASYLMELAKAADKILDDGVGYSYGRGGHSTFDEGPLIKDENGGEVSYAHADLERFIQIMQPRSGANSEDLSLFTLDLWNPSSKRHPKSTDLSRFWPDLPELTYILGKPLVASILDARCEVSSSRCVAPIRLHMSSGGACLALTGMGGWKNRSPVLEYLLLGRSMASPDNSPVKHFVGPGLSDVAYHAAIDEDKQLILWETTVGLSRANGGSSMKCMKNRCLLIPWT